MRTIGNIIWLILGGVFMALEAFFAGTIMCVTIIGIPIGIQLFKVGGFFIWPMGKKVVASNVTGGKTVLNIIWAILLGWEHALVYLLVGLIYCITIIGIPFGKQYFKMARFILLPLGHSFEKD